MTEHTKLTPEQIAAIRERLEAARMPFVGLYVSPTPENADIAALLAHAEALEAENARLRKVEEASQACVDSREFTGREDPHHYRVPNEKLNAVINALAVLHNPELDATQEAE